MAIPVHVYHKTQVFLVLPQLRGSFLIGYRFQYSYIYPFSLNIEKLLGNKELCFAHTCDLRSIVLCLYRYTSATNEDDEHNTVLFIIYFCIMISQKWYRCIVFTKLILTWPYFCSRFNLGSKQVSSIHVSAYSTKVKWGSPI